jgi:hypothetical protein
MITYVADAAVPFFFMLFQTLSDKKLAANPVAVAAPAGAGSTAVIAQAATAIPAGTPVQIVTPIAEAAPVLTMSVKERIAVARKTYGTWEGAKQMLLGTFKDAFETALRRMLRLNPNLKTIDAVRQAVLEVTGVQLEDRACEAIGQIPGFLGAVGANADIRIISDFLDAVDRMKELVYYKKIFITLAVRYAVKDIVNKVWQRVQDGAATESAKQALEEFGLTRWQIDKSQWNGSDLQIWYSTTNQKDSYSFRQFDPWMLAGIDPSTGDDLK